MGTEIERKFLVTSDGWRVGATSQTLLRQGYLASDGGITVRVRSDGQRGWLTVKGPSEGCSRAEFEYEVPLEDAKALLELCGTRVVEKTRSRVPVGHQVWEVDEFAGANTGLTTAEIELQSEADKVAVPEWVGLEVTGDRRFDNASLSRCPYGDWAEADLATVRQ